MGVGDNRVWILDECHNLTNDAQNALLKALEHPPSHVYFILCTDQPECLLAPLKGRCILYKVKPLNHTEELPLLLNRIARKEGKEFKKDDALQFIKDIKEEAEEEAKEIAERKGLKEKDTKAAISLARKQACHPRNAIQALAKVLPTLPDKKKE